MIKMGTTTVKPAGIARAFLGEKLVYYSLPSAYRKLTGIIFSAATYYSFPDFHLRGSDTVRLSLSIDKNCNVFGCYSSTSAQDNYSLFLSSSSGAKYMRYNGGAYASRCASSKFGIRQDIVITPTGSIGMPEGDDTWEEQDFTSTPSMLIGATSASASTSKLDGTIYGEFRVDGRFLAIPVERISDGKIGYFEAYSNQFYAPIGSNPTKLGYA
jgi:hypothetical protein